MKEFEALSKLVRDSLRPEMTDLALYRQMKRFPGLLTNSMCFPFTGGQVVITPTDYRAKKYPFDFVSISDNADGFEISAVILGQIDDLSERIIRQIDNRVASRGDIGQVEEEILRLVGDIHLRHIKDRATVRVWYVGGQRNDLDNRVTREIKGHRLFEYKGVRIRPFEQFLRHLAYAGHDLRDYERNGSAPDLYESGTRSTDDTLNNARFDCYRHTVDVQDWLFALRFMQPSQNLIRDNLEIALAIQYASPLEAEIKMPDELWR